MNNFNFKVPTVEIDPPSKYMWSDTQFELIKKYVEEFESSLDIEHEVGLFLTNFGQSVLMRVTQIRYEESVMLVFNGYVEGKPATLIQHIHQLNFLLTSVDRTDLDQPKRKIGFILPENDD